MRPGRTLAQLHTQVVAALVVAVAWRALLEVTFQLHAH
jgi:hypothetical protein